MTDREVRCANTLQTADHRYRAIGKSRWRSFGCGQHTDYGLLTILKQDKTGGLQVKSKSAWIDADSAGPTASTYLVRWSKVFPQIRREVL
jgi:isopenicillin N synthase-like dioxygenase